MKEQPRGRNWTINGTAQSTGGHFHKVTIRGEARVTGDIDCEQLKVMGTLDVQGNLHTGAAKIMGTVAVAGNASGEDVNLMGEMNVDGDCNAESLKCRGAFDISGLLNAGNIEIVLHGYSRAKEIGGDKIYVKPQLRFFSGGLRRLTVDTVEGDDVNLAYTTARVVRGNRVEIGPGCEIETVEYRSLLRVSDAAKVHEKTKL
ncbi:hypothetical protein GCM10025859_27590 [Alicyclobacillus fastidiosus]|nr:hypothetical protein GCM10025859_27590 [Alicyclobacillus fastidiosus]